MQGIAGKAMTQPKGLSTMEGARPQDMRFPALVMQVAVWVIKIMTIDSTMDGSAVTDTADIGFVAGGICLVRVG